MTFKNNVMSSFAHIKADMDLVKEAFTKVKDDMITVRENLSEWQNYTDLRLRELTVEVKELKEKVRTLEGENRIYY